ncbi:uncharacterized protein Triagg1_8965 [Trichoderma aggressivum f. europaeum]|uniref:Uncharacterized protein n=1 Tax=Trichoderma aggressivum f. europaeum TaxID=173218 RepID=A0AAE1I790_9HYPO|nr:hypothetical protein Triagg1_8965 [Trichoderma aggressivum f. europaeum]
MLPFALLFSSVIIRSLLGHRLWPFMFRAPFVSTPMTFQKPTLSIDIFSTQPSPLAIGLYRHDAASTPRDIGPKSHKCLLRFSIQLPSTDKVVSLQSRKIDRTFGLGFTVDIPLGESNEEDGFGVIHQYDRALEKYGSRQYTPGWRWPSEYEASLWQSTALTDEQFEFTELHLDEPV